MKKKIFIACTILALFTIKCKAQVKQDSHGNFYEEKTAVTFTDTVTHKTFTDRQGQTTPVYISKNGKLYIWRVSKQGHPYKQYLKL